MELEAGKIKIFKDKTLENVFEDIYENAKDKRTKLTEVISLIAPHMNNASDAQMLAPIVKELLDVSVKNDEQLIKLAQVVQRLVSTVLSKSPKNSEDQLLSPEEFKQLTQETSDIFEGIRDKGKDIDSLEEKTQKLLSSKNKSS
jgi:hypothetical protein